MRKVSTLILIIFLLPLPILAGSGNRQPSDQRDKTTTFSFSLDRTFGKSVEVPTRKHKDFPFFSESPVPPWQELAAEFSIKQKRFYNSAWRERVGDSMIFFNQPPDKSDQNQKQNQKSQKRCKKTCRELLWLGLLATGAGIATYATATDPRCLPDPNLQPHTHPPTFSHCEPGLSRSQIQTMGIVITAGGIAALIGAIITRTR